MIEIGLVGAPNSGKSTFFKALTLKDVKIASYPFTTLEPNEGIAYVRTKCVCKELPNTLNVECKQCCDGNRFVAIKLWDVAGLVPDAHLGKGRGNQFLDDVMQSKGLLHILDVSGKTDSHGESTSGYDVTKTIEMLDTEIDYWLVGLVKKDWRKILAEAHDKKAFVDILSNRLAGLGVRIDDIEKTLDEIEKYFVKPHREWSDDDLLDFVTKLRKYSKPILVAANKADTPSADENMVKLKDSCEAIACSAEIELALREASNQGLISYIPGDESFQLKQEITDEKKKKALAFMDVYLKKHGNTGVQQTLNKLVFEMLDMVTVYPVANEHKLTDNKGNVLPHTHLVKRGTTVKDFATSIHTDFADKYIGAIDAKTNRKLANDHELQDGDIVKILLRS
ncbi:MAG: YchF-related putative GTPase [Candidatus Aenigmatarchaeota archaeon]